MQRRQRSSGGTEIAAAVQRGLNVIEGCDSVCAVQQFDTLDDKAADQLLAI